MTYTITAAQSTTVTATESRIRAVLRQVNVDLLAAVTSKLVDVERTKGWISDLTYMLKVHALEYFEIRVSENRKVLAAWRYEVSNDGSLNLSDRGGGLLFFEFPSAASVHLVIERRAHLPAEVEAEIRRLGWTATVESLHGALTRERVYSKDGYGVVRHRIGMP